MCYQATPYLLDLLHDRNPEVQRVCDATLQLIGEVDQEQRTSLYHRLKISTTKNEEFCETFDIR